MPVGFQVLNGSGDEVLGADESFFKLTGTIAVSSASNPTGSVTVSDFSLFPVGATAFFVGSTTSEFSPDITVSGNTLSWANPSGQAWVGTILYGAW